MPSPALHRTRKSESFRYLAVCLAAVLLWLPRGGNAQGRLPPRLQRLLNSQEQAELARPQPAAPQPPAEDGLFPWLKRFHESIPQAADAFGQVDMAALTEASRAVDDWVVLWGRVAAGQPTEEQIAIVDRLLNAKQSVDRQLDFVLSLRRNFAAMPVDDKRHQALLGYLRTTGALVDLSGRLRYALVDVIDGVADRMSQRPSAREHLIDLLAERHSTVGAEVMSVELFDVPSPQPTNSTPQPMPMPATPFAGRRMAIARAAALAAQQAESMPPGTVPLSVPQKLKLVRFIQSAPTTESVYDLADFALDAATPPSLVLATGEALWTIGLPQEPRPDQKADLPAAPITATKLRERLTQIDADKWRADERPRLEALLAKLSHRIEHGLDGNTYRLGSIEIRPGDWLLMRNPSPYNLFTDLAPGLFTHVGVVAMETGSDGKRRMVVVDLPERGSSMPATNVETFLDRTLNYVFLRHPDEAVAKKMADAATSMIGNPTEFDLNFRTDRVTALAGKPLHGTLIHTYCAGLLLLCAQETSLPRDQFFPITETTAGGHTKENMAKLGLSLGEGFVSPTGALFSPCLEIVGHSEPMYDPPREIEEAIFDYFATRLDNSQLQPASDVFQLVRLKVAEASKTNPLLAKALAASANVSEQMDLVSAAKAAVVVETLDEVAFGSSAEFNAARRAVADGTPDPEADAKRTPEDRDAINKYRTRHADLAARWDAGQLSPRALRVELVKFYTDQGRRDLDRRIFGGN